MLHNKKSQSILQWFNSLTTKGDVKSLKQFADGFHFYEIIASLETFSLQGSKEGNLPARSAIFSETAIACKEVITSVEEGAVERKTEASVSESVNNDPFVIKELDDTDTEKKYDAIIKFIDNFYHLESSSLIDYRDCKNGKEMELAKVAVFLLSAMVQNLLSTEDKVVYNTTLLEPEVQENIRECLSLVLVEKDVGENPIKKSELHRILSRAASFKGTPVKRQPSQSTSDPYNWSEGVKNVPKKRKERTSVVNEDSQDSPLRNLLESPKIQYKTAIFRKESELGKLRSALLNEENKVMDLNLEKKNLNEELEKRKKKLEFYKKELESQREEFCDKEEQERLKAEELKNKQMEEERVKKLIEVQKEEIKQLKENNEALQEKVDDKEKKLNQEVTTYIKENSTLKDKIQTLELDNERKDETIKTLNEKITNLENDLKKYQQLYQDISASNSRKGLRSPNVPEILSTIIYADKKYSRETSERKDEELRQDMETKDDGIKRLAELEFGPVPENTSIARDLNASVSEDISEINNSQFTKNDSKMDAQLWTNVSGGSQHSGIDLRLSTPQQLAQGKIEYEKYTLMAIIRQLEKKNCISPPLVKKLKGKCLKINDSYDLAASLKDLSSALRLPAEQSVTTRSRSHAGEGVDVNSLTCKVKRLEQELQVLKQNNKSLQTKFNKKEDELKMVNKNLKGYTADSEKEIENLRHEISIAEEKYGRMKKLVKKKNADVKKSLIMFQRLGRGSKCDKCVKVQKKFKEQLRESADSEKQVSKLTLCIKALERRETQRKYEVEDLQKQIRDLRHKLWLEESGLSKNVAERGAVVAHYLTKKRERTISLRPLFSRFQPLNQRELPGGEARVCSTFQPLNQRELPGGEARVCSRSQPLNQRELPGGEARACRVAANVLNVRSASNSILASHSSFFQPANEDDFFNASSLAEIHSGGTREDECGESRLQELRRRNTLYAPHLQSSYPLEIQGMTPNEKKYYPRDAFFDLGRKSSLYQGQGVPQKKPKSKHMESDDSHSFPVKKCKVAETVSTSVPISKKPCQLSSSVANRISSSPFVFVRRQETFKTPASVHHIMSMPCKSKAH